MPSGLGDLLGPARRRQPAKVDTSPLCKRGRKDGPGARAQPKQDEAGSREGEPRPAERQAREEGWRLQDGPGGRPAPSPLLVGRGPTWSPHPWVGQRCPRGRSWWLSLVPTAWMLCLEGSGVQCVRKELVVDLVPVAGPQARALCGQHLLGQAPEQWEQQDTAGPAQPRRGGLVSAH